LILVWDHHLDMHPTHIWQDAKINRILKSLVWELGTMVINSRGGDTIPEWQVQYCQRGEYNFFDCNKVPLLITAPCPAFLKALCKPLLGRYYAHF